MCHLLCQLLNKTQRLCLPQNTVGHHSLQLISCANRTRNVKCKSQRLQSAQKGVWYLRYPAAQQQSVGRPVFKLWPAGKGKSQLSLRSTERIVQQQCRRDNWMLSEGWRTFVQIDGRQKRHQLLLAGTWRLQVSFGACRFQRVKRDKGRGNTTGTLHTMVSPEWSIAVEMWKLKTDALQQQAIRIDGCRFVDL